MWANLASFQEGLDMPYGLIALYPHQWTRWRVTDGLAGGGCWEPATARQVRSVCQAGSVLSKAVSHWDTLSPSSISPSLTLQLGGAGKLTKQPEFRSRSQRAKEITALRSKGQLQLGTQSFSPQVPKSSPGISALYLLQMHPSFTLQPSHLILRKKVHCLPVFT